MPELARRAIYLARTGTRSLLLESAQTVVSLEKDEEIIGIQIVRRAGRAHFAICREIIARKMEAIVSCVSCRRRCASASSAYTTHTTTHLDLYQSDISRRCSSRRSNPAAAIVIESGRVRLNRVEPSRCKSGPGIGILFFGGPIIVKAVVPNLFLGRAYGDSSIGRPESRCARARANSERSTSFVHLLDDIYSVDNALMYNREGLQSRLAVQ